MIIEKTVTMDRETGRILEEKRAELQKWDPDYEGFKTMSNNAVEYIHTKIMEPGMNFLRLEIKLKRMVRESSFKKSGGDVNVS